MKSLAVVGFLILSSALPAQDAIPAGTILPVQLNASLKSNRARPGQIITARIMQDLPLPAGARIHAGARVSGHVLAVIPATNGKGAKISFRFDTLTVGKRHIPVITNVRALANMMDVSRISRRAARIHGTSNITGPRTRSAVRSITTAEEPSFTTQRSSATPSPTVSWCASRQSPGPNAVPRLLETTGHKRCGSSLPMRVVCTIFPA